jgi:hypothetical protein
MQRYKLKGNPHLFERYFAKSQLSENRDFAMHSLSVEVPTATSSDYVIHLAVVIAQKD